MCSIATNSWTKNRRICCGGGREGEGGGGVREGRRVGEEGGKE